MLETEKHVDQESFEFHVGCVRSEQRRRRGLSRCGIELARLDIDTDADDPTDAPLPSGRVSIRMPASLASPKTTSLGRVRPSVCGTRSWRALSTAGPAAGQAGRRSHRGRPTQQGRHQERFPGCCPPGVPPSTAAASLFASHPHDARQRITRHRLASRPRSLVDSACSSTRTGRPQVTPEPVRALEARGVEPRRRTHDLLHASSLHGREGADSSPLQAPSASAPQR